MSPKFSGKYYGTEINEKWWKRYLKDKMFVRGNGTFSYSQDSITFLRKLVKTPIEINFNNIMGFKTGKWHSGQWGAGRKIIKIIWKKNNQLLSSGFSVSMNNSEIDILLSELNQILKIVKK
jgi:hypothetical protein